MLSQCAYSYGVKIIKFAWVGTCTENFEPTVDFFRDVLGLRSELDLPGFRVLKLPDGSKEEVFGPDSDINRHFTTGPVAGFLVDDVRAAFTAPGALTSSPVHMIRLRRRSRLTVGTG